MKTIVDIVGTGMGPGTLTEQAAAIIDAAEMLIGSPRLIAQFARADQPTATTTATTTTAAATTTTITATATRPDEILRVIEGATARRIAVLMSGDTGFHSGATKVYSALAELPERFEVRLIPGVATPQYFAARLGVPWERVHLVSCHITSSDIVSAVRRHRSVMALTGGNLPTISAQLLDAGFGDLTVWVGENLGDHAAPESTDMVERITRTTVAELSDRSWSSLTILAIDNPHADARCRSGIPDEEFARGSVPMTKQAIRAEALALLDVAPSEVCWDVGCGTGSVTVELALAAYEGAVWAIDKNVEAIELTVANARAFHVGNIHVTQGLAPAGMAEWPRPDVVFIGGTSGNLAEIVDLALDRNPGVRILITAIAIESAASAITALTSHDIDPRITQILAAHGRAAGGLHLLMAQNPVILIDGHRRD